ncbi:dihydrolipoamide acetyltransferase family protein [Macrococcus sp. DPC7161]|uniref:dihydrolipoamide acetyltransferase family protein n=1 Tax=Macrococcus sp. DPC7161 TaxID=2507060 RepID=UPI00100A5C3E|nr:dihydrolipoamide acetyltransferase family protein [Macrococcus sp. DPC7161]RXK19322.1 2-oxo acid dehydrogenase subunit E2 [Macrococcus sp. DPC7161]
MDIKMPKLGESVHEGTIDQWLVKPGDKINEYDPICDVITDKVTAQVPSTTTGVIQEILVEAGMTVEVGTVICKIDTKSNNKPEEEQATIKEGIHQEKTNEIYPQINNEEQKFKNNGRYSPVVFKLASKHQIELNDVIGTGFEGRVTKNDVLKFIETQKNDEVIHEIQKNPTDSKPLPKKYVEKDTLQTIQTIPINSVRRSIANKMIQSVQEIPHAWMMIEVDVTNLVNIRNKYKEKFKEDEGFSLTYFSFFIKAVAKSLKKYPMMHATWQSDEIILNKEINISIAVASDDKLYVPVIKHVDELSIKGIAKKVNEFANKGRNHQLNVSDMQGGSFTVNNTGAFGSVMSMGIINHPQAAILQVETIKKRVEVIDGNIGIRDMCHLCLSIDHRMLDGLMAGQFLNHIKHQLENIDENELV